MARKEIVITMTDKIRFSLKYDGVSYDITRGSDLIMAGQSRPCACLAVRTILKGIIKELRLDDFLEVRFMGIY